MSSKRGRKRNDNLPPNRARDVQRAFRARRAAHLQALEQRVAELEEENECLRQALKIAPANRPPLGRGPTGKDKPKSLPVSTLHAYSRESSASYSPPSRTSSHESPLVSASSVGSRAISVAERGSWDSNMLLSDQQPSPQPPQDLQASSPIASHYHLAPLEVPKSGALYPVSYDNSFASPTRSHSGGFYTAHGSNNYDPSAYPVRQELEVREQTPHQNYTYPYQSHAPLNMTQSSAHSAHPQILQHTQNVGTSAQDASPPPSHRRAMTRSVTEPNHMYGVDHGFQTRLPTGLHFQYNPRPPDHGRQQDDLHLSSRPVPCGPDARLNQLI